MLKTLEVFYSDTGITQGLCHCDASIVYIGSLQGLVVVPVVTKCVMISQKSPSRNTMQFFDTMGGNRKQNDVHRS